MVWLGFLGLLVLVLCMCTIVLMVQDARGPARPPGSHFRDPAFGSASATDGWSLHVVEPDPYPSSGWSGPLLELVDRRGAAVAVIPARG